MTLADDVNLEEFVMTKDEFSGADIKAICTEAGLLALRERRMKVRLENGEVILIFIFRDVFRVIVKYVLKIDMVSRHCWIDLGFWALDDVFFQVYWT